MTEEDGSTVGGTTTTYGYDSNGNLTNKDDGTNETVYEWEVHNKLAKVTLLGSNTVTYLYDIEGNRIMRVTISGVVRYVNELGRGLSQVLMEKDDSGTILSVYTYGNDFVKMRRDSTDSYYLYAGLGSVRQVTDSAKDVTDSYIYEAFGALVASTGSTENTRKFTGEDYDATSSLLYLRARYYDPAVGRFISRDPILSPQFVGNGFRWRLLSLMFQPQALHPYVYCANNPVRYVDKSGERHIKYPTLPNSIPGSTHSGLDIDIMMNNCMSDCFYGVDRKTYRKNPRKYSKCKPSREKKKMLRMLQRECTYCYYGNPF